MASVFGVYINAIYFERVNFFLLDMFLEVNFPDKDAHSSIQIIERKKIIRIVFPLQLNC